MIYTSLLFQLYQTLFRIPYFKISTNFCLIHSLRSNELYATINTTYVERRVFQMTASIRLRFQFTN